MTTDTLNKVQDTESLVNDKRKVVTVDLALGPKFTSLAPVPTTTALPMCPAPSAS
jgi:hypothetical protein